MFYKFDDDDDVYLAVSMYVCMYVCYSWCLIFTQDGLFKVKHVGECIP